uniref:Uncharacterized protein n=1 Tax=Manihot esculenta TaxID=3983 RepID=A0A2C9VAB0_MANES
MSEKPSRHRRRPSQSVNLSFSDEDLSAPLSNICGHKFASHSDQQQPPPQQIRSPLPPAAVAAAASAPPAPETVEKDDKKVTDVAH